MDRVMDSIRNVNHTLVFRIINIIVACFMVRKITTNFENKRLNISFRENNNQN